MTKYFLPIFLLLVCLNASKFKVVSFKADYDDESGRAESRKDYNGDICALIKAKTDLSGIKFESVFLDNFVHKKAGEFWLYMCPGTGRIKIRKKRLYATRF